MWNVERRPAEDGLRLHPKAGIRRSGEWARRLASSLRAKRNSVWTRPGDSTAEFSFITFTLSIAPEFEVFLSDFPPFAAPTKKSPQ
jgi:hypothetical protein